MSRKMKAAVWMAIDQVSQMDVSVPEVPVGWALVKVAYNGICGTDLSILHGKHPRAKAPLVMGHEISGWVEQAAATGPPRGTLVTVEPLISCGGCKACRTGNSHVCRRLALFGIDTDGGMAEYVALPPEVLHPVPHGVDPRTAAIAEPLAVAVHAVDRSGMKRGDIVAIYGAGTIGVLTALVARHEGASEVVITEPSRWRREVVARLGFTVVPDGSSVARTLAPLTGAEGADTTFDCAGHPSVAAELAATTRVHGRIVIVGVYKEPAALDLQAICFKEQSLVGVRVYTSSDVTRAIELIASDALNMSPFPTKAFDLADTGAAFAAARGQDCLKVLVTPLHGRADA